ncbi:MAG: hypothetical protein AAF533_11260 [Acidobacteriota bacterium]
MRPLITSAVFSAALLAQTLSADAQESCSHQVLEAASGSELWLTTFIVDHWDWACPRKIEYRKVWPMQDGTTRTRGGEALPSAFGSSSVRPRWRTLYEDSDIKRCKWRREIGDRNLLRVQGTPYILEDTLKRLSGVGTYEVRITFRKVSGNGRHANVGWVVDSARTGDRLGQCSFSMGTGSDYDEVVSFTLRLTGTP